jgi:hypothetical protein
MTTLPKKVSGGALLLLLVLSIIANPTFAEPAGSVKKISTANLLMPLIFENLDTRIIEYPLFASNGCYRWSSSQSDVLKLEDESSRDEACIPATKVKLVANTPYNNIIWITAQDTGTSSSSSPLIIV